MDPLIWKYFYIWKSFYRALFLTNVLLVPIEIKEYVKQYNGLCYRLLWQDEITKPDLLPLSEYTKLKEPLD